MFDPRGTSRAGFFSQFISVAAVAAKKLRVAYVP
jgi:hypothetical protein